MKDIYKNDPIKVKTTIVKKVETHRSLEVPIQVNLKLDLPEIQKVEQTNLPENKEITFPDIQKVEVTNPAKEPAPITFPTIQKVEVINPTPVSPPASLRNVENLLTRIYMKEPPVTQDVRVTNPSVFDIPIGRGNKPGEADPARYVPVRLTNGKNFYEGMSDAFVSAAKTTFPFVNYSTGKPQAAAVDNDGTLRTDVEISGITVTVSGTTTSGTPGYNNIINFPTVQTVRDNSVSISGLQHTVVDNYPTIRTVQGSVSINDGTNIANILSASGIAAGQNSQLVAGAFIEYPNLSTASVTNNDLRASLDVSNYKTGSIQLLGTWTGTVQVQASNDNSNFTTLNTITPQGTGGSSNLTGNNIYFFPINARYIRIRVTTGATGTVQGVLELYTSTPYFIGQAVSAVQSGPWNVGSINPTASAVPANAFYAGFRSNTGTLQGADVLGQTSVSNDTSHQAAQLTAGAFAEYTYAVASVTTISGIDVSNYKWVSVHVVNQYTGSTPTITFQGSNDNINWVNMSLQPSNSTIAQSAGSTTTTGIWVGALDVRYFRLNFSGAYSSGTSTGVIEFYTSPTNRGFSSSVVLLPGSNTIGNVGSSSATGSAVPANAFYIAMQNGSGNLSGVGTQQLSGDGAQSVLATAGYLFNGASADRNRTPNIFKTVTLSGTVGDTNIWVPTNAKKFRLMAYSIEVTANAVVTSGGILDMTFNDNGNASPIGAGVSQFIPAAALTTYAPDYDSGWRSLGNGYLSAVANNILKLNTNFALTGGKIRVNVVGTEE